MIELKNISKLRRFLKDVELLAALPRKTKFSELALAEYPFDLELLGLSPLYRTSRQKYLSLGGSFQPRICSTMRSLSAQDLFCAEIDYSPAATEMLWFFEHHREVSDPAQELTALGRFHDISLFHEQNHRVVWQLLPPPAAFDGAAIRRYLNFAESLVVMLDVALGDETGVLSEPLLRLNLLYRPASGVGTEGYSKVEYRHYLLAVFCGTYLLLERIHKRDILKAVNYIFPEQNDINKKAVRCSLELSPDFSEVTNPQWQLRFSKVAGQKLKALHKNSKLNVLTLPQDPLDLEQEFIFAENTLKLFGL